MIVVQILSNLLFTLGVIFLTTPDFQFYDILFSQIVHNVKTDEGKTIAVDGVFIAVGILPNTEKFKGLVDLDESGYIIAGEDGVTSTPGIFAAGDIRTKNLRQVVTAVADGANAVASVQRYLIEK